MKSGSRTRKAQNETAAYTIEHSAVDIPTQCTVLHQLMESGELNLLDLPRIQTELERILAATSQRMTCILRHLHGEPIPTPVLRNLGLMEPDPDNQPQHPLETARKKIASSEESSSSLVVSTNPDKPLSLIITSNKKDQQQPSNAENLDTSLEDKGKVKGAPKSVPSSPMPSPHEIPNRFWALMEPYCADITESNIAYLESILKSYVEEATTSKYFHISQSKPPKDNDNISPKRLRKDTATKSEDANSDGVEASAISDQISEAFKTASDMICLARHIDSQLKEVRPASSPSMESLLCSLETGLYEDNVSSVLRGAVAHMAQEIAAKTETEEDMHSTQRGSSNHGSVVTSDLSGMCSQPLKNLARQLQVSSSFRVEKKISQASEELGLFPLTLYLNHLSHRPEKALLRNPGKGISSLPFHGALGTSNHGVSENTMAESKSTLSNGVEHPPKDPSPSPSSAQSNREAQSETAAEIQKSPTVAAPLNGCTPPQSELKNGEETSTEMATNTSTTEPSMTCVGGNEEEDTCPADAEIDGSNADTIDEAPSLPPPQMPADFDENSDLPDAAIDPDGETLHSPIENHRSPSTDIKLDETAPESLEKKEKNVEALSNVPTVCNGDVEPSIGVGNEWFVGRVPQLGGIDDDDDLSSCLLNLTSANGSGGGSVVEAASGSTDQITLALMRRQRELRLVCAANHNILHRLIQAARRDLQRQEIQRRLAIADADVLEAYNKLESYKAQKRSALKRDRDFAWKTLKERQKIRAELDAFDKKPP